MSEVQNLLEAIKTIRPKTALFTTFTVSLSFIDAVLLPQLRQVGCRDIFVLVDANQANRSLSESSSQYAGRHYWVAPVVAPGGGCFHPKVSYLRGEDEDFLAVGSGNLTHPGQSGQLETLDLVSSRRAPNVFRQFSSFARELALRVGREASMAAELLGEHSERAMEVVRGVASPSNDGASLIHTLTRPAADQVCELWKAANLRAERLVVLTPFHSPDGGPLQRLAQAAGAAKVCVGLDSHTLNAPFERDRLGRWKPEFVIPVFDKRDRPLHAKVFEVSGEGRTLVVTGSVNGTVQSLETMKNVEVSLARWLPEPAFDWEPASPAQYSPNSFATAELQLPVFVLEATLQPDGRVIGTLRCTRGELPKSVAVSIWREDKRIAQVAEISVGRTGAIEFRLEKELDSPAGVQLQVELAIGTARCWLNVAEDLRSTNKERRGREAVRNMLQGHFSEEDVFELLGMLTRAAQGNAPKARGSSMRDPQKKADASTEEVFDYQAWRSTLHDSSTGLRSLAGRQSLDALVFWLTTGDSPAGGAGGATGNTRAGAKRRSFRLVAENGGKTSKRDVHIQFDALLSLIPKALTKEPPPPEAGVLAMVVGAAAVVRMVRDAATHPWPTSRVTEWLEQFSRFRYPPGEVQPLFDFALSAATVVMAVADMRKVTAPMSSMKEALHRLNPHWAPTDTMADNLRQHLSAPAFRQAPEQLLDRAIALLPALVGADSVNDVLLRITLRARERGAEPAREDEASFPGVFLAVRKHFQSKPVVGGAGAVYSSNRELAAGGCFHCSHSLGGDGRRALAKRHVAVCPACKRPTFFVTDAAAATRLRSALRHA